MMSELLRELIDASRVLRDPEAVAILANCGIDGSGPLFGLATVETDERFYAPHPEGKLALITGVWDDDGPLIDLVATSVRTRAMRRRRGDGQFIGGGAIERARERGHALHLFTDGWSWMRHRRAGAVVLDWSAAPYEFDGLAEITCESEFLAARLKRAFARPIAPPPISVPQQKEARHG